MRPYAIIWPYFFFFSIAGWISACVTTNSNIGQIRGLILIEIQREIFLYQYLVLCNMANEQLFCILTTIIYF